MPSPLSRPRTESKRSLLWIRSEVATLVGLPTARRAAPTTAPHLADLDALAIGTNPFGPSTEDVDLSPYMHGSLLARARAWWRHAAVMERRFAAGALAVATVLGVTFAGLAASAESAWGPKPFKPFLAPSVPVSAPSELATDPEPLPQPRLVPSAAEVETVDMTFEAPVVPSDATATEPAASPARPRAHAPRRAHRRRGDARRGRRPRSRRT
ncbi:MAG: hypothetical protein AB7S26_34455 [Sandaracinaceae bacterium]